MAKHVKRLTARTVATCAKEGKYPDGGGLYLRVTSKLSKSWSYRYQLNKKQKEHGLGSYPAITLIAARKAAEACTLLRQQGIDPIEHKTEQKIKKEIKKRNELTFEECAIEYIDSHKIGWKNRKHESQWRNTLSTYAFPLIGNLPVSEIDTVLILEVLKPLWATKTETGTRVRQRIENILDWAKVMQYRSSDQQNPAAWRGHLDKLLPKRTKVQKVKHHPAMPFTDLPDYFHSIQNVNTIVSRALQFTILTAARTGEVRFSKWSEIDFDNKTWTIPEERMKAEKEHKVPLSSESMKILNEMMKIKQDDFIFCGFKINRPISNNSMLSMLKEKFQSLTVHGFRSTFRDWIAETTNFSSNVAEMALAHSIRNQVEAAYRRGDQFEKRRKLMDAWSNYCTHDQSATNVIMINNPISLKNRTNLVSLKNKLK